MTATRRLVAILAADVAGYSRLMGAGEPRAEKTTLRLPRFKLKPSASGRTKMRQCALGICLALIGTLSTVPALAVSD
jgi:hypothetical protein